MNKGIILAGILSFFLLMTLGCIGSLEGLDEIELTEKGDGTYNLKVLGTDYDIKNADLNGMDINNLKDVDLDCITFEDGNIMCGFGDLNTLIITNVLNPIDTNWQNSPPQNNDNILFGDDGNFSLGFNGTDTQFTNTSGDFVFSGGTIEGTSPSTTEDALILNASAGQTGSIMAVKDSGGTTLFDIDKYGETSIYKSQNGTTSFRALNNNTGGSAKAQFVIGQLGSGGKYTIIEHLGSNFTTNGIRKANWSLFTNFHADGTAGIGFGTHYENDAIMYTNNTERLRVDGTTGDVTIPADNRNLCLGAGADACTYYDGTDMIMTTTSGDIKIDGGNLVVPSDSYGAIFGAGEDASITFDGSYLKINPREVGSNSVYIGDGTPVANTRMLEVSISEPDVTNIGILAKAQQTVNSSAARYSIGFDVQNSPKVVSGVTNSGYAYGTRMNVLRDVDSADAGTLNDLVGLVFSYGHYSNINASATTTTASGIKIIPYQQRGTITNQYDIFLQNPATGGTVTNAYGIYQQNSKDNVFNGSLENTTDNSGFYTGASSDARWYYNGTDSVMTTTSGDITLNPNSELVNIGDGTFNPNGLFGSLDVGLGMYKNENNVYGLHFRNGNTSTLADSRFIVSDTTDHYLAFAMPGVGNTQADLFNRNRNETAFLFNAGGTERDLAIGTTSTKDLVLGTNNTEQVTIDGTTGDLNINESISIGKNTHQDGNYFGNQIYGEMNATHTTVTIPLQNVYYVLDDANLGLSNGFSINDTNLITSYSGVYHVVSQWSFSGGVTNEYHLNLEINGIREDKCHAERKLGTGGDVGSASYTCLISINAGDSVAPVMENASNNNDATVHDFQLTLVRIGN